ncbi:MAG: hypothetical protein ACK5WS_03475 [Alphaproteobacteria bacterium]|jgi:hypothetical protein|nr:hypothetical protein [Candidatus Jidaibacter sp.]
MRRVVLPDEKIAELRRVHKDVIDYLREFNNSDDAPSIEISFQEHYELKFVLPLIFDAYKKKPNLDIINLHNVTVNSPEFIYILRFVRLLENLSVLDLSGLQLYGPDVCSDDLSNDEKSILSNALRPHKKLTKIILRGGSIGAKGSYLLAGALINNSSVKSLDLNGSNIDDQGCKYIAQLLAKNHNIEHLNIGDNSIGHVGLEAVLNSLKLNKSLKDLSLEGNWGNGGLIKNFSEFLKTNQSLTYLSLAGLKAVDEDELKKIIDALGVNTSLVKLNLADNNINQSCIDALCINLAKNQTLLSLNMLGSKYLQLKKRLFTNSLDPNYLSDLLESHAYLREEYMDGGIDVIYTPSLVGIPHIFERYYVNGGLNVASLSDCLKSHSSLREFHFGFGYNGHPNTIPPHVDCLSDIEEAIIQNTRIVFGTATNPKVQLALDTRKRNVLQHFVSSNPNLIDMWRLKEAFTFMVRDSHAEDVGEMLSFSKLGDYPKAEFTAHKYFATIEITPSYVFISGVNLNKFEFYLRAGLAKLWLYHVNQDNPFCGFPIDVLEHILCFAEELGQRHLLQAMGRIEAVPDELYRQL